jgi:hypothetical protein
VLQTRSAMLRCVLLVGPAGAHYYCETLDITRPFPSDRPAKDPSWAFVWNKALTAPFRRVGLDGAFAVCPALLQVCRDLDSRKWVWCAAEHEACVGLGRMPGFQYVQQ